MIDNGDDSEPHLRWFNLSIVLVMGFLLLIGTVSAAHTPLQNVENIGGKVVVKEVDEKPIIKGWFKPSVRSAYKYRWHHKAWVNYCPYCKTYGTLMINPKGVPERELTCWKKVKDKRSKCGADFDGCTGWVKNGRFNKRLRRA